jgi:small nuclear ribonucleoprotein (snRNP)-like protein
MSLFSQLRNERLIRELSRELNTDVLLFGVDGHTFFGNLHSIDDCRVAILTGAIHANNTDVEILTAGGELFTEATFLQIDLWTIVGKGTGIASDPIDTGGLLCTADVSVNASPTRQESPELIRRLKRMVGDNVVITTLGGFLFEGILGDVEDCLAVLTINDVFAPGTSSSISDSDVRTAVINLNAITSVASATTSRS